MLDPLEDTLLAGLSERAKKTLVMAPAGLEPRACHQLRRITEAAR